MDMKALIQRMTDIENNKKTQLNESVISECGMEGPMAPTTPPPSVSINLTAQGIDQIQELLSLMKHAGLEKAAVVSTDMMPVRQDMERLRDIVDDTDMESDAVYSDVITDEEFANEPDEEYQDHNYMTKDLSGGINKQKTMYKAAQRGDNAMAVETIKTQLYKALAEKKAKPDFLDMDKDGNKKEPMKKAIADKKKKGAVKEAEFKTPTHELDDTARKAMNIAQMIKRKINSGEKMDDIDYNQMAELGHVLSRFGTNFGPQSMKDVFNHMKQYTDDRNEYGTGYPEFNVERFKELLAMAK